MRRKLKVGDRVLYDGLIGIIESINAMPNGKYQYSLVSEEDNELSCSADPGKCTENFDVDLDQSGALDDAHFQSKVIKMKVDGLTDKYFRDGNH